MFSACCCASLRVRAHSAGVVRIFDVHVSGLGDSAGFFSWFISDFCFHFSCTRIRGRHGPVHNRKLGLSGMRAGGRAGGGAAAGGRGGAGRRVPTERCNPRRSSARRGGPVPLSYLHAFAPNLYVRLWPPGLVRHTHSLSFSSSHPLPFQQFSS